MDKRIREAKNFATDEKNRTTVIAAVAGFVAGIAIAMIAGGKAKR